MVWEFGQCLFLYDMWSWGVWGATVWMWAAIIGDVGIVLGGRARAVCGRAGHAGPDERTRDDGVYGCDGCATGWAMWLFWGLLTVLVMWSLYRLFATSRTEAPARDAPLEALQPGRRLLCLLHARKRAVPARPAERSLLTRGLGD